MYHRNPIKLFLPEPGDDVDTGGDGRGDPRPPGPALPTGAPADTLSPTGRVRGVEGGAAPTPKRGKR
jgi:hypothetical protein